MTLQSNVKILDRVFLQEVDDETILLDSKTEEYFSLNEIAGIFYNLLKQESSLVKIVDILTKEFDIPKKQIEFDLLNFVTALDKKRLIEVI